jgi:hypothetical protein
VDPQLTDAITDRRHVAGQTVREPKDAGSNRRPRPLVFQLALPIPECLGLLDLEHEEM